MVCDYKKEYEVAEYNNKFYAYKVEANLIMKPELLSGEIKNSIKMIQNFAQGNHVGTSKLYYTGHLQKDILENFPGRTSKKIFKGFRELLDNKNLCFYQKRFGEHSYEYYVRKVNNEITR